MLSKQDYNCHPVLDIMETDQNEFWIMIQHVRLTKIP